MQKFRHVVIAALISSGIAGVCFGVVDLLSYLGKSLQVIFNSIISILMITFVPNLLGLMILAAVLGRRDRWLRPWRNGLFIPVGILYGQAILLASGLFSSATLSGFDLSDVRILMSVPHFCVVAALARVTAVGILVLFEERSSRPTEQTR